MKKIIVGFSMSTKKLPIAAWLIRLWQGGTKYSHTYIKLLSKPRFPSNKILHAAEGQVSHYSETAFLKRNKIIEEFEIPVTDEIYRELVYNVFHELAGEQYSYKQNIGIVIVAFFALFGKKIKNPWQTGWNCSEYVAHVLKKIYPEKMKNVDPNLITPKDLNEILKQCINCTN